MSNAVRFLRGWMGRPVGYIDRGLDYGPAESLVSRGVAEWFKEPEKQVDTFNKQRANRPAFKETR